jgi:hypothetical protein
MNRKETNMQNLYKVTVCGRTLESRNLRQLLSRAVSEKRGMDRRLRFSPQIEPMELSRSPLLSGNPGNPASGLI